MAYEVSHLEGSVGTSEIEDLDVLHSQGLDRLRRDVLNGEELRREGALVFGARESDPAAADVQRPRQFPHQAVRLPVANADRGDRIPSIDFRRPPGSALLQPPSVRRWPHGVP